MIRQKKMHPVRKGSDVFFAPLRAHAINNKYICILFDDK